MHPLPLVYWKPVSIPHVAGFCQLQRSKRLANRIFPNKNLGLSLSIIFWANPNNALFRLKILQVHHTFAACLISPSFFGNVFSIDGNFHLEFFWGNLTHHEPFRNLRPQTLLALLDRGGWYSAPRRQLLTGGFFGCTPLANERMCPGKETISFPKENSLRSVQASSFKDLC